MGEAATFTISSETYFRIPARALNSSSRQYLSLLLNVQEALPDAINRRLRDYRGLAELMNFEYNELRNFERNEDPTGRMLDSWQARPGATIGMLLQYLEEMGRHDIIQDVLPNIDRDVAAYLKGQIVKENPVQVPEVTSYNLGDLQTENDLDFLTIDDRRTGNITYYDAYICYADEDYEFVMWLVQYLEYHFGFKLYIQKRDLLAGLSEQEANLRMIQERCKRMLLILSNDFVRSPACAFQACYAGALSIEKQRRLLIPLVRANCNFEELKNCKDLYFLRYVSKIVFSEKYTEDWQWSRLISSLGNTAADRKSSQIYCSIQQVNSSVPEISNPCITFPSSSSHPSTSDHCSYLSVASTSNHALPAIAQPDMAAGSSAQAKSFLSNTKKGLRSLFPKRASSKHYQSSNTSVSSSSGATSGFHSQSRDNFESTEVSRDECLDDTSV